MDADANDEFGIAIARAVNDALKDPTQGNKISPAEKQLIELLASRADGGQSRGSRDALEASLESYRLAATQSRNIVKFARTYASLAAEREEIESLLRTFGSAPGPDPLPALCRKNQDQFTSFEVIEAAREHCMRFGLEQITNAKKSGDIPKGRLSAEAKPSYYSQMAEMVKRLSQYYFRMRLVADRRNQPLAGEMLKLFEALRLDPVGRALAEEVDQAFADGGHGARALFAILENVRVHEYLSSKKHKDSAQSLALAQVIEDLTSMGMPSLPLVEGDSDQVLRVRQMLGAMRRSRLAAFGEKSDVALMTLIIRQAYTSNDDAAAVWRVVLEQEGLKRNHRDWMHEDVDFQNALIRSRLSAEGLLLFDQALALHEASHDAFSRGLLQDGGLVCLAYFRVLEVEMNRVASKINEAIPVIGEPRHDSEVRIRRALDSGKHLMLGELRQFFDILGKKIGSDPACSSLLSSVLTTDGVVALPNGWRRLIDEEVSRRFRNPPAHTSFLSWDEVSSGAAHVRGALANIYGSNASGDPYNGWMQL